MAEIVDFGLQQHKIKMDSRYFENVLSVVAGDTGRRIEVQLLDTNGMVQNTTGLNLRLNALVAGKTTFTDATLVDAATGKYQLDLSNGMFLAPGNWQFQWQITDSAGKKLHSFAFTGNVGSNISEGGSQATNFYLNLEDLKKMQEDLVNGSFDSEILETNIAEKLTNLESEYAPKLTEVTAQLAQKVGLGTKAELEDLSPNVLAAIADSVGTPFDLLSIPQDDSVSASKLDAILEEGLTLIATNLMPESYGKQYTLASGTPGNFPYIAPRIAGHKYYAKVSIQTLSGKAVNPQIFVAGIVNNIETENTKKDYSFVKECISTSSGSSILQLSFTATSLLTESTILDLTKPFVLDLTATFGTGKEPTVEQMDWIMSKFSDGVFYGSKQLITVKEIEKELFSLRSNLEQVSDDLSAINISGAIAKVGNGVQTSFDVPKTTTKLTDLVYKNETLQSFFSARNLISDGHFNGNTVANISSGNPTLSTTVFNTKSKSLNVSGTTSQQLRIANFPLTVGNKYFIAMKVKVDRFVSGGGIGYLVSSTDSYTFSIRKTLQRLTNGFETIYHIFEATTPAHLIYGGIDSTNADAYIDDFVLLDITDIKVPLNVVELYEDYLISLNGESIVKEHTEIHKISTTVSDTNIHPADAIEAFQLEVNKLADNIGMTNSYFESPFAGKLTTTRDLIKLGIYSLSDNRVMEVFSKQTYPVNLGGNDPRVITVSSSVRNPLLGNHYTIIGGKTGTGEGYNLVVTVQVPSGKWLVGAIMDSSGATDRFVLAKELFDIGQLYLEDGYVGTHDINATSAAVALVPPYNPVGMMNKDVELLWSKLPDNRRNPASISKLASAVTANKYIVDYKEKIKVKESDIQGGSGSGFKVGDTLTFEDAMHAALMESSNTIAAAIGRTIGEKIIRNKM